MTIPAKPQIPAHIRAARAEARREARRFNTVGDPAIAAVAALAVTARAKARPRTAEQAAAEADYNAQVRAYNAQVYAHNAAILAQRAAAATARQARANAADAAKVRNAACPRCYATHPGEC